LTTVYCFDASDDFTQYSQTSINFEDYTASHICSETTKYPKFELTMQMHFLHSDPTQKSPCLCTDCPQIYRWLTTLPSVWQLVLTQIYC